MDIIELKKMRLTEIVGTFERVKREHPMQVQEFQQAFDKIIGEIRAGMNNVIVGCVSGPEEPRFVPGSGDYRNTEPEKKYLMINPSI